MTTVSDLTCEYRTNPLGLDVAQPRLSWKLHGDRRGTRQMAYQIVAATSEAALAEARFLWDSGRVESDQSIQVPYAGPALTTGQRIYWRVRVWDETGTPVDSAAAWWEMGLLEPGDWRAQWIRAPFWGGPRTASPAPYLRTEFSLSKPVVAARLYATALGVYECHINGHRVGDELFAPGWTNYFKRIQYQVYDVTEHVQAGANAFGVILADGWAVGHVAWLGRQQYADRPQFLAQLQVTYAGGGQETITTNPSWKVTQGPILEADMLMGEAYDARRELPGWSEPGYADTAWWPVEPGEPQAAPLVAMSGPPVKRQEELRPVSIRKITALSPRWVFDLGQNMVGVVRLTVRGKCGTTLQLRFAEALNPDGTLYTTNLRTARSMDFYTLKGGEDEVWEPRFTFHGFRYVEVLGLPEPPTPDTLVGVVIHSDIPAIGSFECSDPLINQLQQNIVWGQKGNFVEVPTDCPQRDERMGWTGDAQVFARTAAFNRDVAGFFTKWTRDVEEAQSPEGTYPPVAPHLPGIDKDGGPAWADAGIICPWVIYQCYGDVRLLEQRYASMQRYLEFLARTSREGLRCYAEYAGRHGYGDWLALDGSDGREGATSKELIGTAFYAYSTGLLAKIARILNQADDAARYDGLAREARAAFQRRFVQPDGTIAGGTQTGYVLALEFQLLPEALRPAAAAALVRDIRQRGNHLSTGFVGTPYINWVLTKAGHLDAAYALLRQTTWPSWLYSVTQGATTIWERWDGWTHDQGFQDPKMNSFNHYAYGAIGAWLYAVVGGIDVDPDQPGYKHIHLRPRPGGGLTAAAAALESPYGQVRSAWTQADGRFEWQVTVPANTTATAYVPGAEASRVSESGRTLDQAAGVTVLRVEEGASVVRLVAGTYHFTSCVEDGREKTGSNDQAS